MKKSGRARGRRLNNKSGGLIVLMCALCSDAMNARAGDRVDPTKDIHGLCSPIVLSPGAENTIITRRLFTEAGFEIAILPSMRASSEYLQGCVISKSLDGYQCMVKRIKLSDLSVDGKVSLDLVSTAPMEVKSAKIDNGSVEVLSDFLASRLEGARYHDSRTKDAYRSLDGVTYDVYVRGRNGAAYGEYSGCIVDPFRKSSYSCSTIFYALVHLVMADEERRTVPLRQLVDYLRFADDKEMKKVDPFVEGDPSQPEVDPPPIK